MSESQRSRPEPQIIIESFKVYKKTRCRAS